jgi:mono/diheme cytochrome c family protein
MTASVAAAVHTGSLSVAQADHETDARTPAPAARQTSRAQGRGLLRLARRVWQAEDWDRLGATPHLAVVAGKAGNQQTPNLPPSAGSVVVVYRLGGDGTIVNDASGQVALANYTSGVGESAAPTRVSTGSAPYTTQQVAQGRQIYANACAICHGANLQGLSAPALTGPSFGRSHLTAAQARVVVTQTMPLTSPGSLKPDEYASVMAYMLSYDCVKPSDEGQQPFPTTDSPALQQVQIGGTTCAPKSTAP